MKSFAVVSIPFGVLLSLGQGTLMRATPFSRLSPSLRLRQQNSNA